MVTTLHKSFSRVTICSEELALYEYKSHTWGMVDKFDRWGETHKNVISIILPVHQRGYTLFGIVQ